MKIAREDLPAQLDWYYARPTNEVRPSVAAVNAAKVVNFVDWHDPKAGYTAEFQIAKEKEYWSLDISGACAVRLGRTSDISESPI